MIPRRIWAAIALAAMLALPVHAQSTAPTDQSRIMTGVVSGHDFGMAMTFDVYVPPKPNGAGIILTDSGGWRSPYGTYKTLDAGAYRLATVAAIITFASPTDLLKVVTDNPKELANRLIAYTARVR